MQQPLTPRKKVARRPSRRARPKNSFGRTVAQAVDEYLVSRTEAGLKAGSVKTLGYRLKGMLRTTERDRPVSMLSPALAKRLIGSCKTKRGNKRPSTDTLVGELVAVQGWSAWCVCHL